MSVRLLVAVIVLGLLAVGLWWTASMAPEGAGDGEGVVSAEFPVFVVGPDGGMVSNGTVVARGTPLDTLRALASVKGFGVEVEQQPWIGTGCTAEYVMGIAGHGETASGGWNYYTRQAGEAWSWHSAGAACHVLRPGDQVEWCWVESDVCRHHVP